VRDDISKREEIAMSLGEVVVLSVFAYVLMAVIAMLAAVMVRGIVVLLQSVQQRVQAAAAPMPAPIAVVPARDEDALHAAAISAAVYAMVGPHRIIHVGEAARSPASAWLGEVRTAHHSSHHVEPRPSRAPR
jgi:hypothetical protein